MASPVGVALSRCLIEFNVNLLPSGSLRTNELPTFSIIYHEHALKSLLNHLFVYKSIPVIIKFYYLKHSRKVWDESSVFL